MISRSVKAISAAGATVIVAVIVYAGFVMFENDQGQVAPTAGDQAWSAPDDTPGLGASPASSEPPVEAAPAAPPQPRTSKARRLANAEAREALVRAITEARRRRESADSPLPAAPSPGSGPVGSDAPSDEPPHGRLSKEYIRETVSEAVPLIRECYEMALEEQNEQGGEGHDLSGTLRVRFVIAGEPDVGGMVQEAEVETDEGLAASETLSECVRETVYTLEFEPPEGGGEVIVTYPFRFSQRREEE
jgi:hypothetical protein